MAILTIFLANITVQTLLSLFRTPKLAQTEKVLAYSTMFCFMFDLNTMDYIMEHMEFTKIIHLSREPSKRRDPTNVCVKYCSYMPLLISNSEIFRLQFDIFIPSYNAIYFITGFGPHILNSNLRNFSHLVSYFW